MDWWRNFTRQANELLQQILYALELAVAGGDDAPWIDTLNFLWDSLPDADKLTTAERRRLARHMKQIVREQVQKHYKQELAQKEAIHERQTTREALAHQHLLRLAEARQRQMQVLSETARQQSMLLPADMPGVVHGDSLWTPFDSSKSSPSPWPLLPAQSLHWRQQLQQQPRQQGMPGRVVRVSSGAQGQQQAVVQRKVSTGSSSSGSSCSRLQHASSCHVVVEIPDCDSGSSNSEIKPLFEGFAATCLGIHTDKAADAELQQPLLRSPKSPFAAAQQQQDTLWDMQQQQQQDGRQYQPPLQESVLAVVQIQQGEQLQQLEQFDRSRIAAVQSHQQPQVEHVANIAAEITQRQQHVGQLQQPDSNSVAGVQCHQTRPPLHQQLQVQHASQSTADTDQHMQQQQHTSQVGSQLLLERYLSATSSGASGTPGADATVVATANYPSLQLCSAECGAEQSLGLAYAECERNLAHSESEPPSECSAAASSVVAEQQSCSLCCEHVADVATKTADTTAAAATIAQSKVAAAAAAGDARIFQRTCDTPFLL